MDTLKLLLDTFSNEFHEKEYKLSAVTKVLKELNNPEKKIKFIHIAGTNGKGSTTYYTSKILSSKYKVGLFTSPHIRKINERIQTIKPKENFQPISDKKFQEYITRIKDEDLTFFEALTIIAILYFKDQKVDYAILEVGMGGRLDSTNVITPEITAITSISLDHQQFLGETIEDIASEKLGIVKDEVPLFTTTKNIRLKQLFEDKTKEKKALLTWVDPDTSITTYQKYNLPIAKAIAKKIGITESEINKILKNINLPGRLEWYNDLILIDGAHNIDALQEISTYIKNQDNHFSDPIVIYGTSKDRQMNPKKYFPTSSIIVTVPSFMGTEIQYKNTEFIKKPKNAITKALALAKKENKKILITGSVYLIGECTLILDNLNANNEL